MPETPAPATGASADHPFPLLARRHSGGMEKKARSLSGTSDSFQEKLKLHGELKARVASPNVVRSILP